MFVSWWRSPPLLLQGLGESGVGAGARSWVSTAQAGQHTWLEPSWLWSLRTSATSSSQRERGSGTYLSG